MNRDYIISSNSIIITFSVKDDYGIPFSVSASILKENNISFSVTPPWFTVVTSSLYYIGTRSVIDVTISFDHTHPSFSLESVYDMGVYVYFDNNVKFYNLSLFTSNFEIVSLSGLSEIWSVEYITITQSGYTPAISVLPSLTGNRHVSLHSTGQGWHYYWDKGYSYLASHINSYNYDNTFSVNLLDNNPDSPFHVFMVFAPAMLHSISQFMDVMMLNTSTDNNRFIGTGFVNKNNKLNVVLFSLDSGSSVGSTAYTCSGYGLEFSYSDVLSYPLLFEVSHNNSTTSFYINGVFVGEKYNTDTRRDINRLLIRDQAGDPAFKFYEIAVFSTSLPAPTVSMIRKYYYHKYKYNMLLYEGKSFNILSSRSVDYPFLMGTISTQPYTHSFTLSIMSHINNTFSLFYTLSGSTPDTYNSTSYFEFVTNSTVYTYPSSSIAPGETHSYVVNWINPDGFPPYVTNSMYVYMLTDNVIIRTQGVFSYSGIAASDTIQFIYELFRLDRFTSSVAAAAFIYSL